MNILERIILWSTILFLIYQNSNQITKDDISTIAIAESMDTLSDLGYKDFKYDFLHLNPTPGLQAEYGAEYLREKILELEQLNEDISILIEANNELNLKIDSLELSMDEKVDK